MQHSVFVAQRLDSEGQRQFSAESLSTYKFTDLNNYIYYYYYSNFYFYDDSLSAPWMRCTIHSYLCTLHRAVAA